MTSNDHSSTSNNLNAMKLSRILIENFRAIEKLDLPFNSQLTLLHGNNAAGKTTILDAIAVGLGAVLKSFPSISGKDFRKSDLRQECHEQSKEILSAPYVRVTLESTEGVIWDRTKKRDQAKQTKTEIPPDKKLSQLHTFLDNIINQVQNGNLETKLPVIAYYGNERAVSSSAQQQLHGKPLKDFNRFGALEGALEAFTNFRTVFEWFTLQENEELREIKKRQDWNYQLPVLKSGSSIYSSSAARVFQSTHRVKTLKIFS
jgi:predicted ATP-binding protein involved in virulence